MLLVIACFLIGLGAKMAGSSTLGADVVVLVWEGLNRTFGVDMGTSNIIGFTCISCDYAEHQLALYWIWYSCRDVLAKLLY